MNVRRSVCVWWYVLCLDGMHFMSENVDYMQLMVMVDGWKCFVFRRKELLYRIKEVNSVFQLCLVEL